MPALPVLEDDIYTPVDCKGATSRGRMCRKWKWFPSKQVPEDGWRCAYHRRDS